MAKRKVAKTAPVEEGAIAKKADLDTEVDKVAREKKVTVFDDGTIREDY
jgi:hypothetical protein